MNNFEIIKNIKDAVLNEQYQFDTWGNKKNAEIFEFLNKHYKGNVITIFSNHYYVKYEKGGGAGMGAYPEKITLNKTDVFGELKW